VHTLLESNCDKEIANGRAENETGCQ
jgi:hypothetical protein